MGSGKGNVEEWCAVVKPGRVMFEMAGISQADAFQALKLAKSKLPVSSKPISKESERLAGLELEKKRTSKRLKKEQARA
jgi:large subunit ribosomal protein L16